VPSSQLYEIGQPVRLGIDWTNIFFFDRASEETLHA
jgi:hypothetical protein